MNNAFCNGIHQGHALLFNVKGIHHRLLMFAFAFGHPKGLDSLIREISDIVVLIILDTKSVQFQQVLLLGYSITPIA